MEKIVWYCDNELIIEFDKKPNVAISYPCPYYGERKNKNILRKPFINKEYLKVCIIWKFNVYSFSIEQGYCWDGASIPKLFWRLIGSNTAPEFIIASMLHDTLCENHNYINNNRYLSTIVLERCLKVANVGAFRRWIMKHSVDNYQKIAGNWK